MKLFSATFPSLLLAVATGTIVPGVGPIVISQAAPAPAGIAQRVVPKGPVLSSEWSGREVLLRWGETSIVLNWIPAGSFRMGDTQERPNTLVHISRGFWVARYEVTQEVWKAIMGTSPSQGAHVGMVGKVKDAPVENISWFDATEFCRKINTREQAAGRLPPGYEYRLPTEAEWEYAGRAGSTTDQEDPRTLDEISWHYGWNGGNSDCHTHAVGLKRPNAWGLCDMIGNVYEWCADWYGPYVGGELTDPAGPSSGVDRVNRGGSFDTLAEDSRVASRNGISPGDKTFTIGCRIVLGPRLP